MILALLLALQEVVRDEAGWKAKFAAEIDAADDTIVRVQLRTRALRYREEARLLEWTEIEVARRAQVQRKKATLEATFPVLGRGRILWGTKETAWTLGTPADRFREFRAAIDRPARLHKKLLDLLAKPDAAALAEFRDKCAEERIFPASAGFLDAVAADAATYASWVKRTPSHDEGNAQADGGQGSGSNRNIANDSPDGFRKRLECFARVLRAEILVWLATEALENPPAEEVLKFVEGRLDRESVRPIREGSKEEIRAYLTSACKITG